MIHAYTTEDAIGWDQWSDELWMHGTGLSWQDDGKGLLLFGQTYQQHEEVGLACVVGF